MSDFKQAIQWLEEGKKVGRDSIQNKYWYLFLSEKKGEKGFVYLHHTKMFKPELWTQSINMLKATDWEIYEEKVELKTLKDIDWYGDSKMLQEILKQEAVKEIKSNFPTEQMPKELRGLTQDQKNAIKDYIKWKNNLTEEDLMTNEQINTREHGEQ